MMMRSWIVLSLLLTWNACGQSNPSTRADRHCHRLPLLPACCGSGSGGGGERENTIVHLFLVQLLCESDSESIGRSAPIHAKEDRQHMNRSRGNLYFHRLFTVRELGFGNPEPFVGPLIRQFLKIGEAVAGRWIEMPQGILILQMVPGAPASGAIYLYDRSQQVFYLVGFDGDEDNLTLEQFNQLLTEYNLVRYAEQPSLAQSDSPAAQHPNPRVADEPHPCNFRPEPATSSDQELQDLLLQTQFPVASLPGPQARSLPKRWFGINLSAGRFDRVLEAG